MTSITTTAARPDAALHRAGFSTGEATAILALRRRRAHAPPPPTTKALAAELAHTCRPWTGASWRTLSTAQRRRLVAVELAAGRSYRAAANSISARHRGCTAGAVFGVTHRWRAELRERGVLAPGSDTIAQIGGAL